VEFEATRKTDTEGGEVGKGLSMATSTIDFCYYINMFGFFSVSGFNLACIWTVLAAFKMYDL
jgi:hypothetical protein